MPVSKLTSKYQATIPKPVRDTLHLDAGDAVEFVIERGGGVRVRRAIVGQSELQELEATLAAEWNSAEDDDGYADL